MQDHIFQNLFELKDLCGNDLQDFLNVIKYDQKFLFLN